MQNPKKIDHGLLKLNNRLEILRALRESGPMSRNELKEKTGLSWGTITAFIKELMDMRVVVETGKESSRLGRKPVGIDLDTSSRFILAMRVGGSYVKTMVMDIKGAVRGELKAAIKPNDPGRDILRAAMETSLGLLKKNRIPLSRLAGIGFTAPGAIDSEAGVCLYSPRHPRWKDVPVRSLVEKRFEAPCFVDHASYCSALGEQWFGSARDKRNFLSVPIGNGISVGIIIDGRVYRGHDHMAGEFGHSCIDPAGELCVCGRRGCIEEYVSGRALARQAERLFAGKRRATRPLQGPEGKPGGEALFLAAKAGDSAAARILERMGSCLGIGLSNLINILNPEAIIISGGVSKAHEFFRPALERALEKHAWHFSSREIMVSKLEDPVLLGAAGIVMSKIFVEGLLFEKSRNGGNSL